MVSHTARDRTGVSHTARDRTCVSHTARYRTGVSHTVRDRTRVSHTARDRRGDSHTARDRKGVSQTARDRRGDSHTARDRRGVSHTASTEQKRGQPHSKQQKRARYAPLRHGGNRPGIHIAGNTMIQHLRQQHCHGIRSPQMKQAVHVYTCTYTYPLQPHRMPPLHRAALTATAATNTGTGAHFLFPLK